MPPPSATPPQPRARDHYHVYVIELARGVLKHRRFREENPDYQGEQACLYVGLTGLTPEQRFEQHRAGVKSGRYPHKYGRWLRPRLYRRFNPMSYAAAVLREQELAKELRRKGYAVWQR